MKNIHVFTADVDRTLRGTRAGIPGPMTLSAFEKLHQKGWLIGIESGRPLWQEMEDHHNQWNLSFQFDFIIGLNGGELMDNLNHTIERYNMLSTEDIRKIVEAVIPFGANPFMYRDGYMFALHTDEGTEASALRHNSRVEFAKTLSDMWEMETSKILVRIDTLADPEGFVKYCQKHLTSETVTCFKTTPLMFEFQSPLNSKGTALHRFCTAHDIDPQEVIAFGDSENDIPMMEYAGTCVAVDNAMDEVKAVAHAICPSVDDDGVGKYLYETFLQQ